MKIYPFVSVVLFLLELNLPLVLEDISHFSSI